jgi:uncharacterized repeat protein (TIGR01451 family)
MTSLSHLRRTRTTHTRRRQRRLLLESLEDRVVPTLMLSLREAGVNGGADVVVSTAPDFTSTSYSNIYGDFTVRSLGAASDNGAASSDLLSSTTSVHNNGASTLTLYLTAFQDNYTLPAGSPLAVESGLGGSVNVGALSLSNIFQAYASSTNNTTFDFTNGPQTAAQTGTTFDTGSATGSFSRVVGNPYSVSSTATITLSAGGTINYSSHVTLKAAPNPQIQIVKLTNGTNNDNPPTPGVPDGPIVPVGSTVTWTYNVTNPGSEPIANVAVTDNIAGVNPTPVLSGGFNVGDTNHNGLLDPGEQWIFTATGTAVAGQYSNIGTVTGTSTISNTPVTANNPDHYFGTNPQIAIVKLTNGTNNDNPPTPGVPDGPIVPVGSTVTWTYNVTNPGSEPIANVAVTDNIAGVNPTPVLSGGFNVGDTNHNGLLDPGEQWVFTATGTAVAGQYSNIGTVNGASAISNTPVTANNPDHYYGSLSLGDFVWNDTNANGIQDSGDLTSNGINGVKVDLLNSSNVQIATTTTTNNPVGGAPGYYQFTGLLQGSYTVVIDSSNFGSGGPLAGYQATPSMVAGSTPANDSNGSPAGVTLTNANDETIDFGYFKPGINIVKLTNGTNNDSDPVPGVPDGPTVPVGSTVTWTYNVTNPTGVALSNVQVSDNIAGVNPTPVLSGGFNVGDTNHDGLLEMGETWVFTATGSAIAGQYSNVGTATGTPVTPTGGTIPGATPVTATNPDHYYGTLSIGDFVWNDTNANGTQDSGDLTSNGINGVKVDLLNSSNVQIATTTTTNNPVGGAPGYYQFSGLLQGSYTVVIDSSNFASGGPLAGYSPTPSMVAGSTTANDSNGSPAAVTLSTANDETIDFGYIKPGISIVKLTNNTNNDSPPVAGVPDGPTVPVGSTVTWTYNVTNPTGVALSSVSVTDNIAGVNPTPVLSGGFNVGDTNHDGLLENGETWVFTASGSAIAGQYSNIGTATGTPSTPSGTPIPGAPTPTATNPDHYFGYTTNISILKLTNNTNNDSPPVAGVPDGPIVPVGSTVTWTYNVTTTGNVPLSNVQVTDNIAGVNPTPVLSGGFNVGDTNHDGLLEAGETWVFTASGAAIAGQYSNIGTATGTPSTPSGTPIPGAPTPTATNPDHYFGYTTNISILKLTNNTNNDSPPVAGVPDGPIVPVGSTVTWTYNVTTTGNVPLSNVQVTDNIAGVNPTPVLSGGFNVGDTNHDGLLEAGETWVFTASGAAVAGQYSNIGTATGTPSTPSGTPIPGAPTPTATNPDHYYGTLSIGDFVWNDVNANGIQDASDLTSNGINGVQVDLKNSSGAIIATTTTKNNPVGGAPGYYQFTGLLQGSYTVVIDSNNFVSGGALFGYTPTPSMAAGSTPANDSNGSPASVTLTSANDETIDFGYHLPPKLSVTKTADVASIAAGQTAGYVVTITNNGTMTDTNVTLSDPLPPGAGSDINWQIDTSGTGLAAGTTPANFQVSGAVGSQTLLLSSAFISGGDSLVPGQSISVHLTGLTTTKDVNSSANPVLGILGQYAVLFDSASGNQLSIANDTVSGNIGVYGPGSVQFSGPGTITGRLDFSAANTGQYHNTNGQNVGPTSVNYGVSTVTTARNLEISLSTGLGALSGTNLAIGNGNQTVNESAGTLQTYNGVNFRVFNVTSYGMTANNNLTIVGDGSGNPVLFNVAYASNSNINGGVVLTGTGLSNDLVMWNFTSSGKNIQMAANGGTFVGVMLLPNDTFTGSSVNIQGRIFGGAGGNMQIVSGTNVNAPPVSVSTLVNIATASATGVPPQSSTATITVVADATFAGTVFCDANLNGVMDANETVEPGAVVKLTSSDNKVNQTMTTDQFGNYVFDNLPAGTYTVSLLTPNSGDVAELSHGGVIVSTSQTITVNPTDVAVTNFAEVDVGSLSGLVFLDINDSGNFDAGDKTLSGAKVTLSGTNYLGNAVSQSITTTSNGQFLFSNLLPSNATGYTIQVTPPTGDTNGIATVGTQGGTTVINSGTISSIVLPGCNNTGTGYNFGQLGLFYGLTATIGFWHNQNGQGLINSFGTTSTALTLANWLATTYPNLFGKSAPAFNVSSTIGTNLTNQPNSAVASYFLSLFGAGGQKSYAQVLATAFAVFTTTNSLDTGASSRGLAAKYGFVLSNTGAGAATLTVSSADWPAFGLNTSSATQSISQLLSLANKYAVKGVLNNGNNGQINETNDVFNIINNNGDIGLGMNLVASGADAASGAALGQVYAGTYLVAVDGLSGTLAADEQARINDAITQLDATLAAFGVVLAPYDPTIAVAPDIDIHLASSSSIGGVGQGVLGVTQLGGQITIITDWNWYTGSDPSAVGASQYDFQTVVTHELGHALGLGHSADAASVMYFDLATGTARRNLTKNDLKTIDADANASPEPLRAAPIPSLSGVGPQIQSATPSQGSLQGAGSLAAAFLAASAGTTFSFNAGMSVASPQTLGVIGDSLLAASNVSANRFDAPAAPTGFRALDSVFLGAARTDLGANASFSSESGARTAQSGDSLSNLWLDFSAGRGDAFWSLLGQTDSSDSAGILSNGISILEASGASAADSQNGLTFAGGVEDGSDGADE